MQPELILLFVFSPLAVGVGVDERARANQPRAGAHPPLTGTEEWVGLSGRTRLRSSDVHVTAANHWDLTDDIPSLRSTRRRASQAASPKPGLLLFSGISSFPTSTPALSGRLSRAYSLSSTCQSLEPPFANDRNKGIWLSVQIRLV